MDILNVAEKTTLAIAMLWALLQLLSLRNGAVNGDGVFPAMIPAFFLFVLSIAVVLIVHLSPLHLLWLAVACFLLGLLAIMLPPVQFLSTLFFALLAKTGFSETARSDNGKTIPDFASIAKIKQQEKKQSSSKAKGFG